MSEQDQIMDVNDLMSLDIDGVEAKYQVRTQPGKYLVKVDNAELDTIETGDGDIIPVVKFLFEVVQVMGLDKDTDADGETINPEDFVGARIPDTFWLRDSNNVGILVGFLTSYHGKKPSGALPDVLATMKNDDTYAVVRVNHRKNKDNPAQPYINVSHDKKEIIGHASLVEQGVIGA